MARERKMMLSLRGGYMRNWRKVLMISVALGSAVAVATAQANGLHEDRDHDRVEGGWYITVNVTDPIQATFDATYTFAAGGAFTRIDGRNNAPAVGTWKYTDDRQIVFSAILFNFVNGVRTGAIAGKFSARIVDGTLTGTFTADGILGLTDFHRGGTFTGTRIVPEAP
jgi:hypothetical protein